MGWRFIDSVASRELGPANDHHTCGKAPKIQCFDRYPTSAPGPTCHLPCPVKSEPALGKTQVGPSPSSQFPTRLGLGESSWSRMMSPKFVLRAPFVGSFGFGCGCETKSGTTGRVTRFQSSVIATGTTGWKFRFELQRVTEFGLWNVSR